ncbi:hypothetical protein SAMN05216392_0378 [Streptococcus equinus]|uniref:Uncharacterized protein n=1 Tax=Streptococcus equinus TaxID=1335 RepID=A0A1H0Y2M4_STREI|nr:hypothetical protein [Streptococcus equinus]QBX24873.1 hypothetical protein Javan214_0036 [Streptococcus phage Javan214]SDQ09343.1 hypothetical protein SAMN05216392_0378 [Streptococcus equinus]
MFNMIIRKNKVSLYAFRNSTPILQFDRNNTISLFEFLNTIQYSVSTQTLKDFEKNGIALRFGKNYRFNNLTNMHHFIEMTCNFLED